MAAEIAVVEPQVRQICRARLGRVDGDDAAQRALLLVWRGLKAGRQFESLAAYAATCARYEVLSARRESARVPVPLDVWEFAHADDAPGPAERVERADAVASARDRVEALLAQLSPGEADAIRVTALADQSSLEGAQVLGKSTGAVMDARTRAMAKMRDLCGARQQPGTDRSGIEAGLVQLWRAVDPAADAQVETGREQLDAADVAARARARIGELLTQLPAGAAEAIRETVLADRSSREAAHALGKSTAAVKDARQRAVARMRELCGTATPDLTDPARNGAGSERGAQPSDDGGRADDRAVSLPACVTATEVLVARAHQAVTDAVAADAVAAGPATGGAAVKGTGAAGSEDDERGRVDWRDGRDDDAGSSDDIGSTRHAWSSVDEMAG